MSTQKLSPSVASRNYVKGDLLLETLNNDARIALMLAVLDEYQLSKRELGEKLDYSEDYVYGWFSAPETKRFRPIHDRVIRNLLLAIHSGLIK